MEGEEGRCEWRGWGRAGGAGGGGRYANYRKNHRVITGSHGGSGIVIIRFVQSSLGNTVNSY